MVPVTQVGQAKRLFEHARREFEQKHPTAAVVIPSELDGELLTLFARACEQHGIERAKALAEVSESDGWHKVDPYIDFSALDAEIAKENEDG